MEDTENTNLPTRSLNDAESTILSEAVGADSLQELSDIAAMFNTVQIKKNMLRIQKLNGLFDKVTDNMVERIEKCPDEFTHKDLLDYMSATQTAIEKAQKGARLVEDTPLISLQPSINQQININAEKREIDTLSAESRNKILDVINNFLVAKPDGDK